MSRYWNLLGCLLLVVTCFATAPRPVSAQPEPAAIETPTPPSTETTPLPTTPIVESNPDDAAAPAGENNTASDAPVGEVAPATEVAPDSEIVPAGEDASNATDETTLQEMEESLPGRKLEPKKDTNDRFFLPIGLGLVVSMAVLSAAMFFILKPHH